MAKSLHSIYARIMPRQHEIRNTNGWRTGHCLGDSLLFVRQAGIPLYARAKFGTTNMFDLGLPWAYPAVSHLCLPGRHHVLMPEYSSPRPKPRGPPFHVVHAVEAYTPCCCRREIRYCDQSLPSHVAYREKGQQECFQLPNSFPLCMSFNASVGSAWAAT